MSIDDLNVHTIATVKSKEHSLSIKMNGNWIIGALHVKAELSYTAQELIYIKLTPSEHTSLKTFIESVIGLPLPITSSIPSHFSFEGTIAENGFTTLTLISDSGTNKYYAIYQKKSTTAPSAKAIAIELNNFPFKKLPFIELDISSIPFFSSLNVKELGVIFADGDIELSRNEFSKSKLLKMSQHSITKGVTAYITVPFHTEPLIAHYKDKLLILTTPNKNLPLDSILRSLVKDSAISKLSFPSKFTNVLKTIVETVKISSHRVSVSAAYPSTVTFFDGTIALSNIHVTITVSRTKPELSATASGVVILAGSRLNIELSEDQHENYVFTATGEELSISKLLSDLKAQVLPSSISNLVTKIPFIQFSIKKPALKYALEARLPRIELGGVPVIQGFEVIKMESIILKLDHKMKTILGFEIGDFNFASLLKTITGFDLGRFSLLSQTVASTVIISPDSLLDLHFTSGKLASLPITKGVAVRAIMKFPTNCNSDHFCKFGGDLVGKSTLLTFEAVIKSYSDFLVSASLGNLKLSKGLLLNKAGIEIAVGTSSQISLFGELALTESTVKFNARISASVKGLSMEFSMTNCWNQVFNAEWLNICNVLGKVEFVPPLAVVGLSFGAEIHLGYKSTGHQLTAKGLARVSGLSYADNYYYVKFSKVTMQSLLKAFMIDKTLPKVLADSGFPNGFESSYSPKQQTLPTIHLTIPAGYRLKGTLNILGLQASADITIDLPQSIHIDVQLPPIQVSSLLKMYESSNNTKMGPILVAKIQQKPYSVDIRARGYLEVLKISVETELVITNTYFKYSIEGKVLGLFEASMDIIAGYQNDLDKASFSVRGNFKLDLFNGIKQLGKNLFESIANTARAAFEKVKNVQNTFLELWEKAKQIRAQAMEKLRDLGGIWASAIASCSGKRCKRLIARGKI